MEKIKEICIVMLFGTICTFCGYWLGLNAEPTGKIEQTFTECKTATDTISDNIERRQSNYSEIKRLADEERELYIRLGANCETRQRINNDLGRELEDCEKILQETPDRSPSVSDNPRKRTNLRNNTSDK